MNEPNTARSEARGQAPPLLTLNASDLRQYVFCPRVVYFRYCLPVRPPPTYKMVEGKLQHERAEDLEPRRTLRAYGLADGERVFGVRLSSERLGIAGAIDMVIVRRHEVIPVEFKQTKARAAPSAREGKAALGTPRLGGEGRSSRSTAPLAEEASSLPEGGPNAGEYAVPLHHKYQLAAYALLAEERWRLPASRCFVHFVPVGAPGEARWSRAQEVAITTGVRNHTRRLLGEMRRLIADQRMPEATRRVERCRDCEYRRFCNDID